MRHMAVTRLARESPTAGVGRIRDRLDRVPSLWRHRCYRQGDGPRRKGEDPWVPRWRPPPIRVTSGRSSPSVPGEDVLVGGPQRGGDRSFARFGIAVGRDAQVLLAKLAHEPLPHQGPTLLQHPRGYAQLLACREVGAAPDPQLHEDGNQRDGLLGEGVGRLLLVSRIRSLVIISSSESFLMRSARMFEEMPSSERKNSRKCRLLANIMSRRIKRLHLSPNTSRERLIGQRERCSFLIFLTPENWWLQNSITTTILQPVVKRYWR